MLASCASSHNTERIDDRKDDIEKKYFYKGKHYKVLIIGSDSRIDVAFKNDSENTLKKSDISSLKPAAYKFAKPYCDTRLAFEDSFNHLNKETKSIYYSYSCPLPADYKKSR